MRVVYSWLKEFIDFDTELSAEDAAKVLTDAGLEVEEHIRVGADFSGVVVAEVVAKRKHPNADKLTLVDVRTEEGGATTEVICGASIVPEPGGRVLWAKPGATLPGGMTLGTKELKGIVSAGMLCAEDELGLGDSHDGIVVLGEDDKAELGSDPRVSLGLQDDVFDLAMPANRADVLGHVGVARELAALAGGRFKAPTPIADLKESAGWEGIGLRIEDSRCSRYVLRKVEGIRVKPSPMWMQHRLRQVGVRPISNIVDVTNYVMFELSQPLHAFDSSKLNAKEIVVRAANEGESIETLDGESRRCQKGDLLICDGTTPVAVAGVMGGANTEVGDDTVSVTLESAQFDPSSVRKTGRGMGFHSESSHRFERFVDPNGCDIASQRAASLLAQLGGGTVCKGALDTYPKPLKSSRVTMRIERCQSLTGVQVDAKECKGYLESLGLPVVDSSDTSLTVDVPTFRSDITREVDLIEEVIRVYGFDRISATLPTKTIAPSRTVDKRPLLTRQAMMSAGYSETVTFGFTSPKRIEDLGFGSDDIRTKPLVIDNPMSIEQSVMRTSLLPNLLGAISNNIKHDNKGAALFEVGRVFIREGEGELPKEPRHFAALICGAKPGWLNQKLDADVFDVKGALELVFAELLDGQPLLFEASQDEPWLHPGVAAKVLLGGEILGYLGEIHPDVREKYEISQPVFGLEICLDKLPKSAHHQMTAVPKYPAIVRDVSMFIDREIPSAKVSQIIENMDEKLLVDAQVLEDYRDPTKVPEGKKGMLWSLTYRSLDRTLTDKEVDKAHQVIESKVIESLGGTKR